MKLSNSAVKGIAIELRIKTEDQLNDLLRIFNAQLKMRTTEEEKKYAKYIEQKIELVNQELQRREAAKSASL